MKITFLYSVFAIVATIINFIAQSFVFLLEKWWALYAALFIGTLAGLITKYVLDKKFIFKYQPTNNAFDLNKFSLYSLTGVFTTSIFWGMETFFYNHFDFYGSQYIGGAIGLMIGYFLKYFLDKNFVFRPVK